MLAQNSKGAVVTEVGEMIVIIIPRKRFIEGLVLNILD
jgi:hypothetical protein